MNVNFFLKDDAAKKTSIQAIIRYKGKRFKFATGVSVEVNFWDKSAHRAKQTREYPDHDVINIKLGQIEAFAKALFIEADIKKIIPTLDEIKQQCTPKTTQKPELKDNSFLYHFRNFKDRNNFKERTKLAYGTTANILEKYENSVHKKLQFEDINIDFYNSFKSWINSTPREVKENGELKYYAANTFGTFIKHIKTVMNETSSDGTKLHNNSEYKHRKFIKETEDSDTIYLNSDEINKIKNLEISYAEISLKHPDLIALHVNKKVEALKLTRQYFLIGCYTALRISDFSRLQSWNVGDKYIRIKPKKGARKNDDVVIPIHPVIKQILDEGFDFSRRMSDQRFNEHVKELCQIAKINEPITVVRTEGGRQVSRTVPKWQLVASHTCRRSGATNMYLAGVPTLSIMKITGHKTERSFMRYIRITQEENAAMMANHPFFNS